MSKQPKNPFHPGEMLLEEFLEPKGMIQAEFATVTNSQGQRHPHCALN